MSTIKATAKDFQRAGNIATNMLGDIHNVQLSLCSMVDTILIPALVIVVLEVGIEVIDRASQDLI